MLLFAVMPFHVYQTSHASPLTVGHFFMMLSLYLFIKFRQDLRYVIPLSISTILLVMSHHLTTYFYLISLIMIVFVENASIKEWARSLKKDVLYILATSGLIFSYWMIVATPVYESFMKSGLKLGSIHIGSQYTMILFYLGFFLMFGIIWLKRKLNLFTARKQPSVKSAIFKFSLTMIIWVFFLLRSFLGQTLASHHYQSYTQYRYFLSLDLPLQVSDILDLQRTVILLEAGSLQSFSHLYLVLWQTVQRSTPTDILNTWWLP